MLKKKQAVNLAGNIHGWMDTNELGWLYDEASKIPSGGTWVEVGTWKGRSAVATGLGLSVNSTLICCDTFRGNSESEVHWEASIMIDGASYVHRCAGFNLGILQHLRPDLTVKLVVEESRLAHLHALEYCAGPIDAVFIDASHEYEDVYRDIKTWLPLVKPGGLIAGHDHCADFPGVVAAVDQKLPERMGGPGTIWYYRKPQ